MIMNERQYKISRNQAENFRKALDEFDTFAQIREGIDPLIVNAQKASIKSQLSELEAAIKRFEDLQNGQLREFEAESVSGVGTKLVEARIAKGLTQKDLAQLLGMKEQQIQRYEQSNYQSASLSRVDEISSAIGVAIRVNCKIISHGKHNDIEVKNTDTLKLPHKEMRKRGWLDHLAENQKTNQLEKELATLFVKQAHGSHFSYALHKKTRLGSGYDEGALLAWKARILKLARDSHSKKPTGELSSSAFLKELASLSSKDEGPSAAVQMLREVGVTVVVEPHLPKTHLDGAAMLLDGLYPVIGLTLRHDRLDNFWFVLFHEIGHLVLHRDKGLNEGFFDDEEAPANDAFETEADDFARNVLIPDELWKSSLVQFTNSPEKVRSFARLCNINPAIVAGRIRRERNQYNIFNDLIGRNLLRSRLNIESEVVGGYVTP